MDRKRLKPTALSVDVEDGVNIAMRDVFGKEMKPTERVVKNTQNILSVFSGYDVKATFFVLGQVAEHYPELIKSIHDQGHEIGVHGYDHYTFHTMTKDIARDQLKRAKALLEDLIGAEVKGHRAPAFSINTSTKWGLGLLAELGYKYDSSIMPCRATHYGWAGFSKGITKIQFEDGNSIYEVPMSTVNLGFGDVPCLGGSYFRLLPFQITAYAFKKVGKKRNPVFYMHPYEVDTAKYPNFYFEALNSVPFKTQLKMRSMWLNRNTVMPKIKKMINGYPTDTIGSILDKTIKNEKRTILEMSI